MKATAELRALGAGQDPSGAANDLQADYQILDVEYGEGEGVLAGYGIVLTRVLIDYPEISEEILFGRMENVEQTTPITQSA